MVWNNMVSDRGLSGRKKERTFLCYHFAFHNAAIDLVSSF